MICIIIDTKYAMGKTNATTKIFADTFIQSSHRRHMKGVFRLVNDYCWCSIVFCIDVKLIITTKTRLKKDIVTNF